ncbi:MAG: hypothetical protein LBK96_05500 [Prevotellaceae bacterium]|jgi:hypothetical protein|nr:hypothetical protein [Prevotellaceae bacterium]
MKNYKNSFRNTLMALLGGVMLCVACGKDDDPDDPDNPKSAACEIVSFTVNGEAWSISGTNITHAYPAETAETGLTPTITLSTGATVNPPSGEAQNFFAGQGVTYTVTAEDGVTTKTYTVKATRTLYSGCEIVSFNVDGTDWDINDTAITYVYPAGTSETPLTPAITLSQGASVNPPSGEALNFFTEQGVTYTVTAEDGVTTKTYMAKATKMFPIEEYLSTRTLRPIESAIINTANESEATVRLGEITEHLIWTEIRYVQSNGNYSEIIRRYNDQPETLLCTNIKRGEKIQIRCAYNPPEISDEIEIVTEWTDGSLFMLKYDRRDWTVLPKGGYHPWDDQPRMYPEESPFWRWPSGHPMLLVDEYPNSAWHSRIGTPLPQALIIDMKESRKVTEVVLGNIYDGYWNHIELYLTNDLPIPDYETYTVDWNPDMNSRISAYENWMYIMREKIPGELPAESWGSPAAQVQSKGESSLPVLLPQTMQGRFLIVLFPDSRDMTYIYANNIEVYSE